MNKTCIPNICVEFLKEQLDSQQSVVLIDVREDHEWHTARIPGAIHLQKDILEHHIHEVVPDKSQTIYLQCQGGVRSMFAAQVLLEQGYKNVCNVEGGLMDWMSKGFPIEK